VLEKDRAGQRELELASLACNSDTVGVVAWGSCVQCGPDQAPGFTACLKEEGALNEKNVSPLVISSGTL